jgi:hypothetical protein
LPALSMALIRRVLLPSSKLTDPVKLEVPVKLLQEPEPTLYSTWSMSDPVSLAVPLTLRLDWALQPASEVISATVGRTLSTTTVRVRTVVFPAASVAVKARL